MTKRAPGGGRPIKDCRVRNTIGLMRHMLGCETGVNQKILDEIEVVSGRMVLSYPTGTPEELVLARKFNAQRISDFLAGRKSIPPWVESTAYRWCVDHVGKALGKHRLMLMVDDSPIKMAAPVSIQLVAEGLVGIVLHAVEIDDERRIETGLKLISDLDRG